MRGPATSEVSVRDRRVQQLLTALGVAAAAVAALYLVRLIAGADPVAVAGGPAGGAHVRPLDRVFIPVVSGALSSCGFVLLRRAEYRPACRLAALAAFTYALAVAVRPFSLESALSHGLAQSGRFVPWLLALAALHLLRVRVSRGVTGAAAAIGLGFAGLMVAVRIGTFAAGAARNDQGWLPRHELAGTVADAGTGIALVAALILLLWGYRGARTARAREPIVWTIGGLLVTLPAHLLLRGLPDLLADPAAAAGAAVHTGALADLLLLPLPAFFLVGTQRRVRTDRRRAISRFWATAIVLAVLLLYVVIVGDSLQGLIVRSYGVGEWVAAFLVLGALFVALLATHALLVRALDRTAGPAPDEAAVRVRVGARGVRDLRMLARSLYRSLGGSLSAASGALTAVEAELEAERDGTRPPDTAPLRLPRDALDSIRGLRRTALSTLAALRRLDAGTKAGSAVVAVRVADLFSAASRRTGRRSALRAELVGGGDLVVECDPDELARAVAELLVNAEEAGVRPRSRITVSAREDEGGVAVEVLDSGARPLGPGRSRVFEPFYSTKPGHDGLGLYISRALIERNGGSLAMERRSGGTCAVVTLPAATP